jgi:hypothetical protein
VTRSRFLHLEDSLSLASPKIRVFAGEFAKNQGMKVSAYHFLDVDDVRVWLADMAWGKAVDVADYKGGIASDNSRVLSRVLKINTREGKFWFEVRNGLGEKTGNGIVQPVGNAEAEISIGMEIKDGRKLAHAVLAYLHAWDVVRMLKSGKW